jgi:hypothetical protein
MGITRPVAIKVGKAKYLEDHAVGRGPTAKVSLGRELCDTIGVGRGQAIIFAQRTAIVSRRVNGNRRDLQPTLERILKRWKNPMEREGAGLQEIDQLALDCWRLGVQAAGEIDTDLNSCEGRRGLLAQAIYRHETVAEVGCYLFRTGEVDERDGALSELRSGADPSIQR